MANCFYVITRMRHLYKLTISHRCNGAWKTSRFACAHAGSRYWWVESTLFEDHVSLRLHWELSNIGAHLALLFPARGCVATREVWWNIGCSCEMANSCLISTDDWQKCRHTRADGEFTATKILVSLYTRLTVCEYRCVVHWLYDIRTEVSDSGCDG